MIIFRWKEIAFCTCVQLECALHADFHSNQHTWLTSNFNYVKHFLRYFIHSIYLWIGWSAPWLKVVFLSTLVASMPSPYWYPQNLHSGCWRDGSHGLCSASNNWNWWEGQKPATDFVSFTRSVKCIFSKWLSTSLSSLLSFSEFWLSWLKIIQLRNSHNPEWYLKGLQKPCGQNLLDGMTLRKCSLAPAYSFKWGQQCWILGLFWENFHKESLNFRGWNFCERLNLVHGFY